MRRSSTARIESEKSDRGDATRKKLLMAAIDVFGRQGFDGATTRELADTAGANPQAIKYYFGDKKGLYLAAADHIVELIRVHNAEMSGRVRARLVDSEKNSHALSKCDARALLTDILQTLAALYVSRESESWARFMMREQMEPTEAFDRIYHGMMKSGLETIGRLLSIILDEPQSSERIRQKALSLLGSVLVFRMANATAITHLGWKRIGPREMESVRRLAADLVAAITMPTRTKG